MKYIPTVGLEIHAELATRTKMFCPSLNDSDEKRPNVNICPICMGHPGTLPVPNIEAIKKVVRAGFALNCKIAEFSKFDRKNYFYPDLPKGYQISQYDKPLCENGYLDVGEGKKIRIRRIHLEEDAGRLLHPTGADYSLVDFNRAGVPLMELVTEPDIHSQEEAKKFAEELQLILRYLEISGADMEKGQMRVEVNLSLAEAGAEKLGTKVEVKNLNSFRAVERAIVYEIQRQNEALESGEKVIQETRGWDETHQKTFSQRLKEEAHDYRYFPEPDIPPLHLTEDSGFSLDEIKRSIGELPQQKRKRFIEEFQIAKSLAEILVRDKELANYCEKVISELIAWEEAEGHGQEGGEARQKLITLAVNYLTTDLRKLLSEGNSSITECKISPENFAEFISLIHLGKISSRGAKDLLPEMLTRGSDPHTLIGKKGLGQVSDESQLNTAVEKVIRTEAKAVADYKSGKTNILQFLVGQVMKETKGKANPQVAAEILTKEIA